MKEIAVVGSKESGHGLYPGRTTSEGTDLVLVEGIKVHLKGHGWGSHCHQINQDCHIGTTSGGSSLVFIEDRSVARVGDSISCGGRIITGNDLVLVGD